MNIGKNCVLASFGASLGVFLTLLSANGENKSLRNLEKPVRPGQATDFKSPRSKKNQN